MDDNLLISQQPTSKEPAHERIELTTLVQERIRDFFCRHIRESLNDGQLIPFRLSTDGLLQRNVHSKSTAVIPKLSQQSLVHMAQHTQVAGHSGGRKMFPYLHQHFYCPSMSEDAYNVVENCTFSADASKSQKHVTELKTFPATESLTYVSINILSPLM